MHRLQGTRGADGLAIVASQPREAGTAALSWPVLLAAAAVVTGADQWVKALVTRAMPPGSSVPVIDGILSLTHVQNHGVAFGLMAGVPPIVTILAALTLVLLLAYNRGRQLRSRISGAGLALMAGGAVGNLTDRIRFGFVVDYVDVHVWPVFNLADAAIVAGAGLVLLALMRSGPGAGSEVKA